MSNDQIDMTKGDINAISIGLSWVAYVKMAPIIATSVVIMIIVAKIIGNDSFRSSIFYFSLVAMIVWNAYVLAMIQSKRLIINSIGVWFISGFIPWQKKSVGLQWRNVGVVSYNNNFVTYVTKSYTVNICDRYTEKIALTVNNINDGAYIIAKINSILESQNHT